MRISEENISYNVQCLINEALVSPFEYAEQTDNADHQRLLILGYIRGVLDLANIMKGILKE